MDSTHRLIWYLMGLISLYGLISSVHGLTIKPNVIELILLIVFFIYFTLSLIVMVTDISEDKYNG